MIAKLQSDSTGYPCRLNRLTSLIPQGIAFALLALPFSLSLANPVVSGLSASNENDLAFAGRVLLSELSCTTCHQGHIEAKGGPVLDQVGGRIHPDYLEKFIAAPHTTKPGTSMPDLMSHMNEKERTDAAGAISDYLLKNSAITFSLQPIEPERVENGRELFHRVGCVACHSPEKKDLADSPPLQGIETKYSLESLTVFLKDPLESRPSGRMPDMQLSHWEALDIANYLLREQDLKSPETRIFDRASEGEVLFKKMGCMQCHQPSEAQADYGRAFDKLDHSKSCTSAEYSLSPLQKKQISAALKAEAQEIDSSQRILLTMARLNCTACHQRGENGGPSAERDEYFTTSNLNLGEQARIPPSLKGVGAKLKQEWLQKVITGGTSVRPYMNTRMPKFGIKNIEKLPSQFAETDSLPPLEFERVKDAKLARETGQQLAGDKNLSCVACHTYKGESATTLNGVELTSMTQRLQENWFHHYMRNPQQFHPTTIMPGFWPGGKPTRPEILDGNTGKQIDAIWQYLSRGKEGRTPSGIRRKPLYYSSSNGEAVMLRRQYRGIGKRGIGVGYPAKINLSFDAGQLRLGSIWKGEFGEMSGVWRSQGSGNVNENTREVVRFPTGPAFAQLPSEDTPWPTLEEGEKAEGFQFLGYSLDTKQRPEFRYTYAGIEVRDYFVDSPGQLTRKLTFAEPMPQNTYFRIANDEQLQAHQTEGNSFKFPHGLKIELSRKGNVRKGTELIVPLEKASELSIKYQFESE